MQDDAQAIRGILAEWHDATVKGDTSKLLTLMADDVVFMVTGQPPMRGRTAFATGFQTAIQQFSIDYTWTTHDLQISGDLAYCWNELSVVMTPRNGNPQIRRSGHTLTVLRKHSGQWVLSRDANLLMTERP